MRISPKDLVMRELVSAFDEKPSMFFQKTYEKDKPRLFCAAKGKHYYVNELFLEIFRKNVKGSTRINPVSRPVNRATGFVDYSKHPVNTTMKVIGFWLEKI